MNPIGIVNFAELFLLEDGKPVELAFETFLSMVLDLRESNTATVKDVMKTAANNESNDVQCMDFYQESQGDKECPSGEISQLIESVIPCLEDN